MASLRTFVTRYPALIILVACFALAALLNAEFLTPSNLYNLLRQIAPAGIAAVGMAIVIIAAGIDLSMGAMVALAGVVVLTLQPQLGSTAGIVAALAMGLCAGLMNGFLVAIMRINAFIGSLGTMMVLKGIALTISNSQTITGRDPTFAALADYPVFGIPLAAIVFIAVFAVIHFVLTSTPLGRAVFAIGGNREASRTAGLKVEAVLLVAYMTTGFLAALTGIVISSQINSGSPIIGDRIPLFAIAAVLIGGVSMQGGSGSLIGVVQGVLILAVLQNGMNLYGVGGHYQITTIGVLLVGTMMLDEFLVRRRRRMSART